MTGDVDGTRASERFFVPRRPFTTTVHGAAAIEVLNWHSEIDANPATFSATMSIVVFENMALVRIDHAPSHITRTADHVKSLSIGSTFYVLLTGSAVIRQGGHELTLTPGDIAVVSGYSPYTLTVTEQSQFVFVLLRRGALNGRGIPHPETDTRQFGATPFALSVSAFTAAISLDLPRPASPEGVATQQALLHLLTGLLLSNLDSPPTGTRQSARLLRALTFIAANYSDTSVDTARVAAATGLSNRHLQRVLAIAHTSVAAELRRARMQWASIFLTQPERRHSSLEEVAVLAGFGNLERMRRAFAKDLGMTPAQYRARGPADEHTGLLRH